MNLTFSPLVKEVWNDFVELFGDHGACGGALKPIDDQPCWSIACFFIDKSYRKKGISTKLLGAACGYAKDQGATMIDGYPVEPKQGKDIPPAFAWTGIPVAFERAGFKEVLRRSPTRPIMRMELD